MFQTIQMYIINNVDKYWAFIREKKIIRKGRFPKRGDSKIKEIEWQIWNKYKEESEWVIKVKKPDKRVRNSIRPTEWGYKLN
jgi:hypothetical protein